MDPNETLRILREALARMDYHNPGPECDQAAHDAADAAADLLDWIDNGGFHPDWSK